MSDLRFELLKWQTKLFQSKTRFKVVMAGRRCGKSRFAIVSTIVKALECPDPTGSVIYIAPTQQMARVLCWDLLHQLGQPVIASSNIANSELKLVNGVKIYVRGADNPDSLRGMKLYYAVCDESKDFKPDVWPLIIRPSLSDMRGGALHIGTPEPGDNPFNTLFDYAADANDPEWEALHLTTYDNELIDPKEIEAAKRSLSTQAFNQEYMASREAMMGAVFKDEWLKYAPDPPKQADCFIAVDPAGFEDVADPNKKTHLDSTAIAVVKVDDEGKWFVQKIDYGRWDVRETAVKILMAIRTHKPRIVGIEKGSLARALTPYLSDLMRKNNVFAHIEYIAIGSGSKANRITYNLQGLFEHGRITLNSRENWDQFKKEYLSFPNKRVHDDLIDSLSLVANLVTTTYAKEQDDQEYEVLDDVCGF